MRILLGSLALIACDPGSVLDAGAPLDAAREMDVARPPDAGLDASGDAASGDAGPPIGDASVPCSVAGTPGSCVHVDACSAAGNRSTRGLCPGPTEIQCCTPVTGPTCDPMLMPTPNDGAVEAPGFGGCPSGMTRIDSFCIDVFEASLARVSGGTWSPFHNPGTEPVRAVSIRGNVPQGYITGEQAADACAAAGKRLCTDDEWQRACRGPGLLRTYPYAGPREDGR